MSSTPHVAMSGTVVPVVRRPRSSIKDLSALKDASPPSGYPPSQVSVYGLTFEIGRRHGEAGELLLGGRHGVYPRCVLKTVGSYPFSRSSSRLRWKLPVADKGTSTFCCPRRTVGPGHRFNCQIATGVIGSTATPDIHGHGRQWIRRTLVPFMLATPSTSSRRCPWLRSDPELGTCPTCRVCTRATQAPDGFWTAARSDPSSVRGGHQP